MKSASATTFAGDLLSCWKLSDTFQILPPKKSSLHHVKEIFEPFPIWTKLLCLFLFNKFHLFYYLIIAIITIVYNLSFCCIILYNVFWAATREQMCLCIILSDNNVVLLFLKQYLKEEKTKHYALLYYLAFKMCNILTTHKVRREGTGITQTKKKWGCMGGLSPPLYLYAI